MVSSRREDLAPAHVRQGVEERIAQAMQLLGMVVLLLALQTQHLKRAPSATRPLVGRPFREAGGPVLGLNGQPEGQQTRELPLPGSIHRLATGIHFLDQYHGLCRFLSPVRGANRCRNFAFQSTRPPKRGTIHVVLVCFGPKICMVHGMSTSLSC